MPKDDKRYSPPPGPVAQQWLERNDCFRQDVLRRLRESGPLMSATFRTRASVPWQSTGWTNNRNVTQMLEFLSARGEVAAPRRPAAAVGSRRARVPDEPAVPLAKARRALAERRMRWLGISRAEVIGVAGEPVPRGAAGEPAEVEVRGRVGGRPGRARPARSRAARRCCRRSTGSSTTASARRSSSSSSTILEMYKPAAKRRWGYFALPILHGDRLVGKLDATADRKASTLRVHAIHEDVRFTRPMTKAVRAEIDDLASWLGLEDVVLESGERSSAAEQLRVPPARNRDRPPSTNAS